MKENEITPSQEAINLLKDSLKDFYVLLSDNMWGKKGDVVKHIRDYGPKSQPNSEWKNSDGTTTPLVAAGLKYLIEDKKRIIPLYEHLQNGGQIKLTKLSKFFF